MKKFLSSIFVLVLLVCCGFMYGCGEKYSGLTFSVSISYNKNGENVEELENGDLRVTTPSGTFDDHLDGSYTFYISSHFDTTATIKAQFSNAPSDFNYDVAYSINNEVVRIASNSNYVSNGVEKTITAFSKGNATITFFSREGDKSSSIMIEVVEVSDELSFGSANLAIINKRGSTLTFDKSEVLSYNGSMTSTDFEFGVIDEGEFVAYTDTELLNYGLSYNKYSSTLTVVRDEITLDDFSVKATYDNPLGEDLVATALVSVVNEIDPDEFKIFRDNGGRKNDATDENELTQDDILDLIINIDDLNYADIILRAKSNGELVNFDRITNSLLPVNLTPNNNGELEFTQADGITPAYYDAATNSEYARATYTYCYLRIAGTKKTTDNDNYPNGCYPLMFTCDYANYSVDNYPLTNVLNVKNDALIRNFSVNGVRLASGSIIEDTYFTDIYESEVYMNTANGLDGTTIRIDVGNPLSISAQNAKFKLALYDSDFNPITSIAEYFSVQKSNSGSASRTNIIDNFASEHDKNTTFYFLPNTVSGRLAIGQAYYLIVTAVKPNDFNEKQAKATVKLLIVQGINEFTDYSYTFTNYEVDEETGEYVVDDNGNKIKVETTSNGVLFEENTLVGVDEINLDIESGFGAKITLSYLPDDASTNNIEISSSNEKIFDVVRDSASLNSFSLVAKSIGKAYVKISTTNIAEEYSIYVNVYRPITNFNLKFASTKFVGQYTMDANDLNVLSAEVESKASISFIKTIIPTTANRYSMEYFVYKETLNEDGLVGTYSLNYDGEASSTFSTISNEEFIFDCANESFVFTSDASAGKQYYIIFKLTNVDGSVISRTINVKSFVPVESIDSDITKTQVYNPNTIAYSRKTGDVNDPTAFGIKIQTNKKSGRIATYNFENYGRVVIIVNGLTENIFDLSNGLLNPRTNLSVVEAINFYKDTEGYYWFRLNENYEKYATLSTLVVSAQIYQLGVYIPTTISMRVLKAELVSSLTASSEENLYFKQGLTSDKSFNIQVKKDTSFDKTLLVKTYDLVSIGGENYYIDNENASNVLQNTYFSNTDDSSVFNLNISAKLAGQAVVVVMAQDKIITESHFDIWSKKEYLRVTISEDEFLPNFYFVLSDQDFVYAEEYDSSKAYFILATNIFNVVDLWTDCLVFYATVADGIKVPYQISNFDELLEIPQTMESVTKRYVLTKDIIATTDAWQPIGNYYEVEVNDANFSNMQRYSLQGSDFYRENTLTDGVVYYSYGFDGEFVGKYVYFNVKTKKNIIKKYRISNISYSGNIREENFGFFADLGENAKIRDISLSYINYQPTPVENFMFGGICPNNYGNISNVQITFNNFNITSASSLIVGGIAARNYGKIENNDLSLTGLTGNINVTSIGTERLIYGGLVGINYNTVLGSFRTDNEIVYTYNDAGFDSSIKAVVNKNEPMEEPENVQVGGAIGRNEGRLANISIQGSLKANNCANVGGLVGYAVGTSRYNGPKTNSLGEPYIAYSVESSYSTVLVDGLTNVGGAIGFSVGPYIFNVSAENYANATNYDRTFVKGESYVGGLIGNANSTHIDYCYVVSYFGSILNLDQIDGDRVGDDTNYDIIGINVVGGLIGNLNNVVINNSAVEVAVKANDNDGIFVGLSSNGEANNVFAIGTIFASTFSTGLNIASTSGYFYYYILNSRGNSIIARDSLSHGSLTEIKETMPEDEGWAKAENINGGLPYLTIQLNGNIQPLFATTPITISANIKENTGDIVSFIKNDENSLILFFNYDYLNRYLVEEINLLNILNISEFSNLIVSPLTHKSARLDLTTDASNVIAVNSDGRIRIIGEGRAVLTVSSKLNSEFRCSIYIVVKYGVNDIDIYSNVALTNSLKDAEISILKSRNQVLYVETSYIRETETVREAELKSTSEVGVRFIVAGGDELNSVLDAADDNLDNSISYTLNDLFKMNGFNWAYDGENYFIDISSGGNPIITPLMAMGSDYNRLEISYVPYIKTKFSSVESVLLLDKFAGKFDLSIIKGATEIVLENNIENYIEISQIQTQTFTITLFTDYELDEIIDNTAQQNASGMLIIVKSDIMRSYKQDERHTLESISITYTINYKDKINAIENDLTYNFRFQAASDTTIVKDLIFVILGQQEINQVYGVIYSNLTDFPQDPSKNNIVYNANVAALSIEVYPYFSNYNRMRLYYQTASNYPLLITQLSYDITGESGDLLTTYIDSGSITDMSETMFVEKSSGQDTYLLNTLGTYSYSKIYFFSLLVATAVPDDTQFTVFVEFLNRQNTIIDTFEYTFTTTALPSVSFEFDESLKSEDGTYYLPINTDNKITVTLVNYEGDITWEITSADSYLSENDINVMTPTKNEDGTFNLRTLRYTSSKASDNVFTTNAIGRSIRLTAFITDNQKVYEYSQDITLSLFTVTAVHADNVTNGYMTLPMSTTTLLQTSLDVSYDKTISESDDNWYAEWYATYGETKDTTDQLYSYLTACGYEISEYFTSYFTQLSNAIAKVNYNYNDAESLLTTKTSGIWFYDSSDETAGYLQTNNSYNDSTFGVEIYNEFFAVCGYQINKNSNMSLRLNLSYTNNEGGEEKSVNVKGVPNVYNYDISMLNTTYETTFFLQDDFILTFVYKSDLINAIPVSTAEEFCNMQAGYDYRLVNDIELKDYTPISTAISSFDGNNYRIYISSFSYSEDFSGDCALGLFNEVSIDTMLYNISVYYTARTDMVADVMTPSQLSLSLSMLNVSKATFGGLACTNRGTITNCKVEGRFNLTLNVDINSGTIADALNGGLVATNAATGFITNSKVINFDLASYGITGGFVGENIGKVVSSYFDASTVNNSSSENSGGFVYRNSGYIYECFVQGCRGNTDNDIRNTGSGLISKGSLGGFVYSNTGVISDSYSNISLNSSRYLAGFVYTESQTSIISRCYSISSISSSDNSRVASPFAGANSADFTSIAISGQLNNCYYLTGSAWINQTWSSSSQNKKATELTLDEFATHTNFANFDLSLSYISTETYADSTTNYSYVDGYTWVIIEGKPVLVSTLVDTISQRNYRGKTKQYSSSFMYYDEETIENLVAVEVSLGSDRRRVSYYNNIEGLPQNALTDEQLVFYTIQDNNKARLTYYFLPYGEYGALTITYQTTLSGIGNITSKSLLYAEYTIEEDSKILDTREMKGLDYIEDSNFRANDTVEINYNEDGIISAVNYRVLESASYYYSSNSNGVSYVVGDRTNPQIIYDFTSFVAYLTSSTSGKYFRVVRDIDFNHQFATTAFTEFQGSLQGNYMQIYNLSISYLNGDQNSAITSDDSSLYETFIEENVEYNLSDKDSFGLFGMISTIDSSSYKNFDTVISNLTVGVVEVLSNSHKYVGGLVGKIKAGVNEEGVVDTDRKVILNNINITGVDGLAAFVQGKNAVGGLAGAVYGNVIIKDISCSANVNATKEILVGAANNNFLYVKEDNDLSNVAYAGGVIGLFDAVKVEDKSTLRDYNATNISISGDIRIIGGIVGSAFGFVGSSTKVNYINTTVNITDRNYLRAIAYAGGLVGENRGEIVSSSITYGSLENYSSVKVGTSSLTTANYFYNGSYTTIAVGGLVGLNNGGIVSNCISTVNVRNLKATIAGGAVGRLIEGKLEYVIASGSVKAETIIGGLVGTANDRNIVTTYYRDEAIMESEYGTTISNCVAANNWLIADYNYYVYMMSINRPVGGFVGLISQTSGNEGFISYEGNSYYVNTLYTSATSTNPSKYLKVAYTSNALDMVASFTQAQIEVLLDEDGTQIVYPYSTREMYYEDTFIGPNFSVEVRRISEGTAIENPYMMYVFTIVGTSSEITNIDSLYKLIDFNNPADWDEGVTWTNVPTYDIDTDSSASIQNVYNWYLSHFGKIYTKTDNGFEEINSYQKFIQNTEKKYYYVRDPAKYFTTYTVDKTYTYRYDNMVESSSETLVGVKYDKATYTELDDLKLIDVWYINGLYIKRLSESADPLISYSNGEVAFYTWKWDTNTRLPNGALISNLEFNAYPRRVYVDSDIGSTYKTYYEIRNVVLKYKYDISDSGTSQNKYIKTVVSDYTSSVSIYNLSVSSKSVIFEKYLSSAYWIAGDNFLLNANYQYVDKYLQNIEFADVYLWSQFAVSDSEFNEIKDESAKEIYISTPEQFAKLALEVNSGNYGGFEGYNIYLQENIDLSGKYWVPMGNDEYPFKGSITGKVAGSAARYSIRYVTVNKDSCKKFSTYIDDDGETIVNINDYIDMDYAGVFGYSVDAKIDNIDFIGGDIFGNVAGGVLGFGKNTSITNVINRNNVTGNYIAGGIVGEIQGENNHLLSIVNYGEVTHENYNYNDLHYGGIVGKTTSLTVNGVDNYGTINVFNTRNSYSSAGSYVTMNIGGIIGSVTTNLTMQESNNNYGEIIVYSNSHNLNVGGSIGSATSSEKLMYLKNYSTIDIQLTNIRLANINDEYAKAMIGGVVGRSITELSCVGNEGIISFRLNTVSNIFMAIGGVAGYSKGNVSMSYNANDIELATTGKRSVLGVGGIVGLFRAGNYTLENCYNSGDISSDSNSIMFAGGILGTAVTEYIGIDNSNFIYGASDFGSDAYAITVRTCLNIGYINILGMAANSNYSIMGAIVGFKNNGVKFNDEDGLNYYLRGSAFSGNTLYNGYGIYYRTNNEEGYKTIDKEVEEGCQSKISSDLKDKSTYVGWDFEEDWEQIYDTWYPSIKANTSASMWSNKQEEVSQRQGAFVVNSAEQLSYLADKINNGEIDSSTIRIRLTNFIDLANRYWTPIGNEQNKFKGSFDGNGYIIKNLTIDGAAMNTQYGGLFGYIENASISNVGLESPIIKDIDYAASIVCFAENSRIEKVYADCEKSLASAIIGREGSGGLAYRLVDCIPLDKNSNRGGLYYSFNNVPVKVLSSSAVGGIACYLYNSLLSNSYNNVDGNITTQAALTSASTNNGLVIAYQADVLSRLFNVFNLASYVLDSANDFHVCQPRIYYLTIDEENETTSIETNENSIYDPLFENLAAESGVEKSDVWTQEYEYSLNESVDGKTYPSIRGLGEEWKNTESETLVSVSYGDFDDSIDSIMQTFYQSELLDSRGNPLTTLVTKFYDEVANSSYLSGRLYYFVSSEEELSWISTYVNNGNLSTSNVEFILLRDLDLSGKYWTPIGSSSVYPFQGIFNFNGHKISGLTIDSSNLVYGGLFGYTNGATIVNGYLTDTFIKVRSIDSKTNIYVGALVGKGYNTTIKNVSITATMAAFSNSGAFVGGAIGSLTGTKDYNITNVRVNTVSYKTGGSESTRYIDVSSYKYQTVEVRDENGNETGTIKSDSIGIAAFSNGGNVYCGGIVGYISGYELIESENEYLLSQLYNKTNIAAVTTSEVSYAYGGGIVGYALEEVKLNNVQNSGMVKTYAYQSFNMVGGILGYMNNGNIQNAYFDGYIECCQDFNNQILSYVGGIVGYMRSGGYIRYSANYGTTRANENYARNASVGAIIGYAYDRTFENDRTCLYSASSFNFDPIGYYPNSLDTETSTLVSTLFISNLNISDFDRTLWSVTGSKLNLNSRMIAVMGSAASFEAFSDVDSNISLATKVLQAIRFGSIELSRSSGSWRATDKIGIGLITAKGSYLYREVDVNFEVNKTSENSNKVALRSYIDDYQYGSSEVANEAIVCYLTLIAVEEQEEGSGD